MSQQGQCSALPKYVISEYVIVCKSKHLLSLFVFLLGTITEGGGSLESLVEYWLDYIFNWALKLWRVMVRWYTLHM